MTHTHT